MGFDLLLDKNQISIGMRMHPGNQSKMPVVREVIAKLKEQNSIKGQTIHIADKGVNCAQNIALPRKW